MFAKNNELNDDQKAYREYYFTRLRNATISIIYLFIIPLFCFIPIVFMPIMMEQLQYTHLVVLILGSAISAAASICYTKIHLKKLYSILIKLFLVLSVLLMALRFFSLMHAYDTILSLHLMFTGLPIVFGVVNFMLEFFSFRSAIKIMHYINSPKKENHTAIILPHDAQKIMDVSDLPVPRLIIVLKKYHENFQIYFCLHEDDMVEVLTKPKIEYIKRIWIFGHGDRGGCSLTDKYFSYEDFMTKKMRMAKNYTIYHQWNTYINAIAILNLLHR